MDLLFAAIIVTASVACFIATFFGIQKWIGYCFECDLTGKDLNKLKHPKVPEMGGVPVVIAFLAVLAVALAELKYMGLLGGYSVAQLASLFLAIGGIALVGALDDWYDMKKRYKAVLPMPFVIPFAYLFPNHFDIFTFSFTFALWLEVLIVAFMVDAAANASNMLEGYNGLGIGLVILIDVPLVIISVLVNEPLGVVMGVIFLGGCLAFWYFNRYPARVFPGDILTLSQGAILALIALVGDFEEIGAILFLPMIVNAFITFARIRTDFSRFGYRNRFGLIRYSRSIAALPHYLANRYQLKEWQLSMSIHLFQFAVSMTVLVLVLTLIH